MRHDRGQQKKGGLKAMKGNGRALGPFLLALVVLAAAAAAFAVSMAWRWDQTHAGDHEFVVVIPKGTAILQAQGRDSLMVPQKLRLTLGDIDTLVIRNDDDWPLRIGPFRLEAGQQYRQRFRSPGVFKLVCTTMYHEDQLEITVVDSPDLWRSALAHR